MGSNNFGNTYENSVFIAETSANLVKRLKLNFQEDGLQKIDNPYVESEFLRSKNELFRPVYTATGNDGDLYVVDMNKGVIQHVTYLTNYLRKYVKEKHLNTIIDQGRIFKISKINNTKSNHINLSNLDDDAIIQLLQHPNRSVRTHAQWNIAGLKKSHLIPQISDLFKKDIKDFTKIHILYTLHALAGLNKEVLESACQDSNPHIKRLGISLSNLHNVDVSLLFGKLTTFEKYVFLAGQAEYIHKNPNKAIKIVPFLDEIAKDTVLSAILAGKVWENNTNQTIHSILPHLENKSSILYNFLKTNPTKTENKNENIAHLNL
ncbi:MAG TPA: hypothetical protein PKD85_23750, partial [Saprospiraceae bacterium]|nr:hypothetical protein [Saprospiraceae bacterium]